MAASRHVAFLVGMGLVVILLAFIPLDVFIATRALLLVAAGIILLLFAAAMVLSPARQLLARLFGYGARYDGPALRIVTEPEWRNLMHPLFTALVLLAAAILPTLVRAV